MAITKIKANSGKKKPTKTGDTKSKAGIIKTTKPKIKAEKTKIVKPTKPKKGIFKVFDSIKDYFKGAWSELKQVHWPNRKASWAMTSAVILFTGFFILLIIVLDFLFQTLFKFILK